MLLTLFRFYASDKDTLGLLYVDGVWKCIILEDEYREVKVPGETRIPAGKYRVVLEHSPKFSVPERYNHKMLTIVGVPHFSGIRIHRGVNEAHTDGCPLVGLGFRFELGRARLYDTHKAYAILYGEVSTRLERGEEAWIEIIDERAGLAPTRV